MPFEQGEAIPFVQPGPPVRAFYLASIAGGGPVNLVLLGMLAYLTSADSGGGADTECAPAPLRARLAIGPRLAEQPVGLFVRARGARAR